MPIQNQNNTGSESLNDDQKSNASRSKPINLNQHSQQLELDDEDEIQRRQELIYNVSGEVSNFRLNPVEIYGFVAWVVTAIFTILYTVYAWTPDSVLNSWGLTYLPNKYYLIAIPNWIGTSYICANLAHDAVCLIKSHPRQSYFTLQDRFTKLSHPRQ